VEVVTPKFHEGAQFGRPPASATGHFSAAWQYWVTRPPHFSSMLDGPGFHNRQPIIAAKIRRLLHFLSPSTYDEIAPKIEYWIEYVITEQFTTINDLVERVSAVAWEKCASRSDISRFLKEFRDAPHRSERTRSFVDELCLHILRWFAIAAAEDLPASGHLSVMNGGKEGFTRAALFVGHLIKCGLLNHDLVRRHLIKPLVAHHGYDNHRAKAIYRIFVVAGNTLLQGLLEPKDVQVCFEILDILREGAELKTERLNVRCDSRPDASCYDLTCTPGTSRDPHYAAAVQGGGRARGCCGS
jgi:hypothetical protein